MDVKTQFVPYIQNVNTILSLCYMLLSNQTIDTAQWKSTAQKTRRR